MPGVQDRALSEVPTVRQLASRWAEINDMDGAVPGTNPVG